MEINLGKIPFDLDFHPTSPLVAVGLINGDFHLYHYASDARSKRLLEVHAHNESCRALRFVDSGRVILTGSPDCSMLASDVETGRAIARLDEAHGDAINRLVNLTETTVASGDDEGCIKGGRKVICGTQTGALLLYSWGHFKDCSDRFLGHPMSVDTLLKLDEDTLISGSEDGVIRLVGILPNRIIQPLAEHSEYPIERLALSKDKQFLGSISHDQMLKLWDLQELLDNPNGAPENQMVETDSDDEEMDVDVKPLKSTKGTMRKKSGKGQTSGSTVTDFFADL